MFKDILVSIDLSDNSREKKVLPIATDLARSSGAVLHVITVVPDFGSSLVGSFFPQDFESKAMEGVSKKLHEFTEKHVPKEIKVQHNVAHGTVYDEILKKAKNINADLIVIGASRPDLKDYLLGPNAARVLRHANCSVFVVR